MLPLLLFLLVFIECRSASAASLVFNRVDIVNDIHKHVYIKIYGHSRETVLMYTMILFRSPRRQLVGSQANKSHDHYHNALLIGSHTYRQYYKITKDSQFEYNNEIPLIARGVDFMIPFSVVEARDAWNRIAKTSYTTSSSGTTLDSIDVYDTMEMDASSSAASVYHAILSVDRFSSIWDHYNVMTLTPYYVTMRYESDGLVHDKIDEYGGLIQLQCRYDHDNRCVIDTDQLVMGHLVYNNTVYRLIIDLHSSANYLPTHLYFPHQELPLSQQGITVGPLILNSQFTYIHNAYDNDIIIGVDLLHIFPKVEISIESGEISLWYFETTHVDHDRHESVAITLTFLLLIALYCYFDFISNEPGFLFQLLVRRSNYTAKWFFFAVRQVFTEITIISVSTLIMLLTLIFAEYNTTYRCQRTILFALLTFYHIVILFMVLIVTPHVTKKAFESLKKRNDGKEVTVNDGDYVLVKEAYLESDTRKLSKEWTINVIARNTCLIVLIMTSILMKINFSTEESYLYLLMLFFVSLIFLYFMVHYVVLGWLYWITFDRPRPPLSFVLFICGELGALLLFIGWSIPAIYLDYLRAINSVYTEAFIVALTIVITGLISLLGCRSHYNKVSDIIQKDYVK